MPDKLDKAKPRTRWDVRRKASRERLLKDLEYCGITYCADLEEDETPWEVTAEPEPQYFETLREAIQFYWNLFTKDAERETRERCVHVTQEIRLLLKEFALAESSRLASGKSANATQWGERVKRVEELGII